MKKLFIILIFFLIISLLIPKNNNVKMVMSDMNNNNHYELIFKDENLNLRNIKLKLGLFTSYEYNIPKIYIKYNENIKDYFNNKDYFSFDSSNFNIGIEKLIEEYNIVLQDNHLYDELDKDISDIIIEKVEIYCEQDALDKFKDKYPNVIINRLDD
ncbi:MAG: hypothetical protein IJ105_03775 [Bacilli bacterium]|nr:hypothetical protein [Bacilli bacterium]